MRNQEKRNNILVIDDDQIFTRLFSAFLKDKFQIFVADKPSLGFRILDSESIDFVFCDFRLPEMDGLQVLKKIKADYPLVEVIMISNSLEVDTVIGALRSGAIDYFKKPLKEEDIFIILERAQKVSQLHTNLEITKTKNKKLNEEINKEFGVDIIGSSSIMKNIKHQMQMVAQSSDTSVLLIGESGTGKEIVARGIHNLSSRRDELFGAVNMAAVPEALFESEFFGHKKGSFTGAISERAGWFESLNNGTLFLDEIGEMPMSLQVKLLRVLEERAYNKVGTQKFEKFDIRIIGATNKSEQELSSGKEFRLDLFHRIGTFIIHLPALRNRKEDIPELTEFFMKELSTKTGKKINKISEEVFNLFNNYAFPGNIRELRNIIERAIILCQKDTLLPEHFNLFSYSEPKNNNLSTADELFDLKEIEKQTIIRALKKVNYNKAEAAELLNIEWNALYRRIQKYGIKAQ
jgi:DNA-binding NtrC family response regulator